MGCCCSSSFWVYTSSFPSKTLPSIEIQLDEPQSFGHLFVRKNGYKNFIFRSIPEDVHTTDELVEKLLTSGVLYHCTISVHRGLKVIQWKEEGKREITPGSETTLVSQLRQEIENKTGKKFILSLRFQEIGFTEKQLEQSIAGRVIHDF